VTMRLPICVGTARHVLVVLLATVVLACGPQRSGMQEQEPPRPAAPKRIVGQILGDLKSIGPDAHQSGRPVRGLLQAGLANVDERGRLRAQLAETLPSTENGLWQVSADGRMQTTWKLTPNTRWHDGTPVTSDDLLFTSQVAQDRELPAFRDAAYQLVQSVDAVDAQTIVVSWKDLYIGANQLFPLLLPRHILETPAREDKASFLQLPYWSAEFVGTGAFKVREWVPGSSIFLEANDAYVLGRPKVDEIEVKIVGNSGPFVTNLLAGVADMSLGLTLSLDQALEVRSSWQSGRVEVVPRPGWVVLFPQLVYSNPLTVGDVRFRRALLHGADRQELVETLVAGLSSVAHTILPPGQPDYAQIRERAPKYEYDPRRAVQMIEELGYVRVEDGGFFDPTGQRLAVELRTGTEEKAMFSMASYWQRLGVSAETVVRPAQQADKEYLATYPGFRVDRHTADETWLVNFTSATAPTRENNWSGNNYGGYRNAEFDALHNRYTKTIPIPERLELVGEMAYRIADQAIGMGLYYDSLVACVGNRVVDFTIPQYYGTQFVWSAYLWDVRS
jgi:peptide/nickel transport system substrate-binding protein